MQFSVRRYLQAISPPILIGEYFLRYVQISHRAVQKTAALVHSLPVLCVGVGVQMQVPEAALFLDRYIFQFALKQDLPLCRRFFTNFNGQNRQESSIS